MNIIDIILIALSLSMDALTVSICKGITIKNNKLHKSLIISIFFGLFQTIMPIIGYKFGSLFNIDKIDHWISFIILSIIGFKMIKDAILKEDNYDNKLDIKTLILLSIATSIDALVIGISFSFLKVNIILSSIIIGTVTFILCFIGSYLSSKFTPSSRNYQIVGGLTLFAIGLKILFEHLKII